MTAALLSGCATARLDSARTKYYAGDATGAAKELETEDAKGKDRVLLLMERGTVRQGAGDYERSAQDYILAYDELERMAALQVAQNTSSFVVNDNVQDYRGAPYERTMLHVFTAMSHLARGDFEDAAVEARRTINSLTPEAKGDYPDDAFSRYMAGFCLEMMDDRSNAALQYRKAAELVTTTAIDDRTGRLVALASTNDTPKFDKSVWPNELVCFVMIGRPLTGDSQWARNWKFTRPMYAEIHHDGKLLGRSHSLSDTADLAFTTEQKQAAMKAVKTAARIAMKETISYQIEKDNEGLGELVRFLLIGLLEQPDTRRWETLPRWMQVARVPCPAGIESFDVVFKNSEGVEIRRKTVTAPISRKRDTHVSLVRDL